MTLRLNREIKAYCPDFEPVRRVLREWEAVFIEVKGQVDYYYHLPKSDDIGGTRRLKLRVEKGERQLIYYVDRQEGGARISRFQIWDINDPQVEEALDESLGTRVIVRKSRELWRKENIIFNLDTVDKVGQIVEVEVQDKDGCDIGAQVEECRGLLNPFLGSYIDGSNEDLVIAAGASQHRGDSTGTRARESLIWER